MTKKINEKLENINIYFYLYSPFNNSNPFFSFMIPRRRKRKKDLNIAQCIHVHLLNRNLGSSTTTSDTETQSFYPSIPQAKGISKALSG